MWCRTDRLLRLMLDGREIWKMREQEIIADMADVTPSLSGGLWD